MKCKKCNGYGYLENPKFLTIGTCEGYEMGVEPWVTCVDCSGSGFRVENYNEVLNNLNRLLINTQDPIDRKTIQETLDLLKHGVDEGSI